ncbi:MULTISPECIES: hypothetical protein [unclassified Moorena]|uniref:hypothetical protein n=1 Tax=unclassified Moorena TaxID=2683338 RepID=UPI00140078DA|nr:MULTISPECIES: hypothetical protein [unclassified Moorena]NEO17590.1 hypothetical protein [Moorena sp. SIO3E8]NEQ04136.1 hypothetical protein [Moorena sp. SIO3F7]
MKNFVTNFSGVGNRESGVGSREQGNYCLLPLASCLINSSRVGILPARLSMDTGKMPVLLPVSIAVEWASCPPDNKHDTGKMPVPQPIAYCLLPIATLPPQVNPSTPLP